MNSFSNPFDTPQQMVRELAGMPLTILFAMFIADVLPISELDIGTAVACTRRTARKHLAMLEAAGLIFKTKRFDGWDLTPTGRQLPMPWFLPTAAEKIENGRLSAVDNVTDGDKSYPSLDVIHKTKGKNYPSPKVIPNDVEVVPESKGKNYPSRDDLATNEEKLSTLYIIDRQIDRKIVNKYKNNNSMVKQNIPHPISVAMLRRLGVSGNFAAMACLLPSELIAAWWMCQWGREAYKVLAKHLLDGRAIDPVYVRLAEWRMVADAYEVDVLLAMLANEKRPLISDLPYGLDLPMYDAALWIYGHMGDLPMWCD